MRVLHFLSGMVIATLIAMAFASSATGDVAVSDEDTQEPCPEVVLDGHSVSGGCPIEIDTTQETLLIAGTPSGPVIVSSCETTYEGRIDGSGEGYLDDVDLLPHQGSPCTRAPCDEADHTQIPWPIHIRETGGQEALHMVLCLRHILADEGTPGTTCERSIPMTQTSDPHVQEFNGESGVPCTNLPPGAVSFVGHWQTVPSVNHPEIVISH